MLQLHFNTAEAFLMIASGHAFAFQKIFIKYLVNVFRRCSIWKEYEYKIYCLEDRIKSKRRLNVFENFFQQPNGYVTFMWNTHNSVRIHQWYVFDSLKFHSTYFKEKEIPTPLGTEEKPIVYKIEIKHRLLQNFYR